MKKNVFIFAFLIYAIVGNAQKIPSIESLFKIGVFSSRTEGIMSPSTGDPIIGLFQIQPQIDDVAERIPRYAASIYNCDQRLLTHALNNKFDLYTTVGIRFKFYGFAIESENKIRSSTDGFTSFSPYSAEFYIRGYYSTKNGFKIGYEHLCIHPIRTENLGQVYNIRGGHDEFFISYNL